MYSLFFFLFYFIFKLYNIVLVLPFLKVYSLCTSCPWYCSDIVSGVDLDQLAREGPARLLC